MDSFLAYLDQPSFLQKDSKPILKIGFHDRHANLHLPHIVIAEFPAVSCSSRVIPIIIPQVSINLGRLGMGSALA